MTSVLSRRMTCAVPIGYVGAPRLLRELDVLDHRAYRAGAGPLPAYSREALLAMLEAASVTGRGGAAFPLAAKIRSLRPGATPVVVINGAEGEPVSAKDHALLSRAPQLVLDGAELVARAIGAPDILVAVADPALAGPLRRALDGRQDPAGGPGFELHGVPDRFISGEARALIAALSGAAPVPPGRRVLPTDRGVDGRPTLLSNAETFAQLAQLARFGTAAYCSVGTAAEPGTTLLTVSGAVASPGVLEVPLGTSLGTVAAAVGARPSQAVVIGGYHGAWLAPDPALELSRAGLSRAGGTLGAGVVIFVGDETCALAELARVARWLAAESAKQCGPCAFGLPALAADVAGLAGGAPAERAAAAHLGQLTGRGACAHPDGAVRFIRSGLAAMSEELRVHRLYGDCQRTDQGHLATVRSGS